MTNPQTTKELLISRGMTPKEADSFLEGIERGLKARREGRMEPWSKVKEELGMPNPTEKLRERIRKILWSLVDDPITKRADYIESPTKTIWNIGDQILQACKESGLKFVPDKWETPIGITSITEVLKWVDNINSQIGDIEL